LSLAFQDRNERRRSTEPLDSLFVRHKE